MGIPIRSFLCAIGAAAVTAVLLFSSAPAQAEEVTPLPQAPPAVSHGGDDTAWRGWIVKRGRVFRADEARFNEKSAKLAAKGVCEKLGGYTCDIGDAIAIPDGSNWVVSAIACERRSKKGYFLGASAHDGSWFKAVEKAGKAGFRPSDCSEIQLTRTN